MCIIGPMSVEYEDPVCLQVEISWKKIPGKNFREESLIRSLVCGDRLATSNLRLINVRHIVDLCGLCFVLSSYIRLRVFSFFVFVCFLFSLLFVVIFLAFPFLVLFRSPIFSYFVSPIFYLFFGSLKMKFLVNSSLSSSRCCESTRQSSRRSDGSPFSCCRRP